MLPLQARKTHRLQVPFLTVALNLATPFLTHPTNLALNLVALPTCLLVDAAEALSASPDAARVEYTDTPSQHLAEHPYAPLVALLAGQHPFFALLQTVGECRMVHVVAHPGSFLAVPVA